jgi:hypothetical protein
MNAMERLLRKEKLLATAEKVAEQIAARFPQSGLSQVGAEVVQVTREALVRAEKIRRPDLLLRGGLILLAVVAVLGVAWEVRGQVDQIFTVERLLHFLDVTKGSAAYLAAIGLFLVTLEIRLKRRRALRAIHELRAMAHIIDMHQLAKDPDLLDLRGGTVMVSGRPMDAASMGRYLGYCTELLALVSKVGQLYIQDFPDGIAVAAEDQFENLATGLSQKVWQKLMILERLRTDGDDGSATGVTSARKALDPTRPAADSTAKPR